MAVSVARVILRLVKRILVLVSVFASGCSAPAPAHVVQPEGNRACVELAAPSTPALYGRVTDGAGKPLAGVAVDEVDWSPLRGEWDRIVRNKTLTRADGAYELQTAPGTVIVFELDRQQVVWAHSMLQVASMSRSIAGDHSA
jgi:hypothetical protein